MASPSRIKPCVDLPQVSAEAKTARIIGAFSVATFVAEVGAAWFLSTSLRAFKQKLKVAYYLLVAGILTYALFLLPSIALIFGIGISLSVQPLLTLTPYVFGALIIFIGIRLFATQLAIKTIWSRLWFVAIISLLIAIAVGVLSKSPFPEIPDAKYGFIMGLVGWSAGFNVAATIVTAKIRGNLGGDYKKAVLWLMLALGALSLASIHELLIKSNGFVFAHMPNYFAYTFWPYLLTAIFFLKAGIAFKAISKKLGALPENAGYLDVITYVAQLASDPKAIDPTLDKVRSLTARGAADGTLSSAHKAALVAVYKQLETYLSTKEPLLHITKEELRARLPADFLQELNKKP